MVGAGVRSGRSGFGIELDGHIIRTCGTKGMVVSLLGVDSELIKRFIDSGLPVIVVIALGWMQGIVGIV